MSNVKNRIFIDLDGTIIDTRDKYYEIYKNAKTKFGLNIFNKKIYLRYRKKHCFEKEIILKNNKNSLIVDKYLYFRLTCFESKKYLVFDKLILNRSTVSTLKDYDLYLITMRKNRRNLIWELKEMNIYKLFKEIVCRNILNKKQLEKYSDFDQKKELLNKYYPFLSNDILIGDTKLDYSLGKYLRLKTFIVKTNINRIKICNL